MPYIVTTKKNYKGDSPYITPRVSRRAVATLDEAHFEATRAIGGLGQDDPGFAECHHLIAQLAPEQGGTVTLPDGTVIEVERVDWYDLSLRMPGPTRTAYAPGDHRLIAAYNAAQEG